MGLQAKSCSGPSEQACWSVRRAGLWFSLQVACVTEQTPTLGVLFLEQAAGCEGARSVSIEIGVMTVDLALPPSLLLKCWLKPNVLLAENVRIMVRRLTSSCDTSDK